MPQPPSHWQPGCPKETVTSLGGVGGGLLDADGSTAKAPLHRKLLILLLGQNKMLFGRNEKSLGETHPKNVT